MNKLVSIVFILSSYLYASSIEGLGDLDGGYFGSYASAVSSDGSVVVGYGTSANGPEAFRWSAATNSMVGLGDLTSGSIDSSAYGVNSDGSVVVGYSYSTNGTEAFRWSAATNSMVGLGDLAGGYFSSVANAVNSDGSVVVGYGTSANGYEAFRWSAATNSMVGLGDLAGGSFKSRALGVNSDGSVVVGYGTSANGTEAFRWSEDTNSMVGLGDLAGGSFFSNANAVNSDGSVVVGYSSSANGTEAFRWSAATNSMVGLGDLAGGSFYSRANAVNSDGSIVVGRSYSANGYEAFRWSEATGMLSLSQWLKSGGYTLAGWSDTTASGVSDDGNTVVGYGTSANGIEAFIAKNTQGMIGITDFTTSIESINSISNQAISNLSTMLHGAHGHPGNRRAIDDKRVMWFAGDISSDNRHNTKDDGYVGEFGVSIKHNDNFTYSVALGKLRGDSKLSYKGTIDNDGEYIALDADVKLLENQDLYSTTMLVYGQNDLTIKRGYDNAGVLTHSSGDTKQKFIAFKQRVQYHINKNFYPYIEFNHIKVDTNAYSESGGGFPATYDKTKESVTDYRVGIDANFDINSSNRLITTLEGVHRVQDRGNGISGQISGLGAFNVNGRAYEQDWMRATIGLEHTFENKSRFSLTLNRTSKGEEPLFWSGFNYSIAF